MTIKTVSKEKWHKYPKYRDFPYMASVKVEKALATIFPYTEFEKQDAESGNYANVCESFDGGVHIFAKNPPEKDITVTVHLLKKLPIRTGGQ